MGDYQKSLNDVLIEAIITDDIDEAKRSLADGADSNTKSLQSEQTALELVVRSNRKSTVEFISVLMTYGADPIFIRPGEEWSPFTWACASHREGNILTMLNSEGLVKIDLLMTNKKGETAAMSVAQKSSFSSVHVMSRMQQYFEEKILPQQNAGENMNKGHLWLSLDKNSENSFMISSNIQNKRWIIEQNFIAPEKLIEMKNDKGQTALCLAILGNMKPEVAQFLLGCGAKIDVNDSSGQSLFEIAEKEIDRYDSQRTKDTLSLLRAVDASRKAMAAINNLMALPQGARP